MFYDVKPYKSYDEFVAQKQHQKPYRSSNAYPLGDRDYSSRHWRMCEDGSINIYYINRGVQDEYDAGKDVSHKDWVKRRKLATVYPDNTVEFFHSSGQGDNGLLSRVFGINLYQSSKRGGLVLEKDDKFHPVFHGQRFKMGTFESATPYQIFQRRVNRKLAAEAMEKYKEFLSVGKAMVGVMDEAGLREVGAYLVDYVKSDNNGVYRFKWRALNPEFFELVEKKHYVDAAVLFAINFDVNASRWRLTNEPQRYYGHHGGADWLTYFNQRLFPRINAELGREVCIQHDTFNTVELGMGELKTSRWPAKIISNGVAVCRL